MSQLVFSKLCNHNEVGSNASEEMTLLVRGEQADKKIMSALPCPLYRHQEEGLTQIYSVSSHCIRAASSHLKNPDYQWVFHLQMI